MVSSSTEISASYVSKRSRSPEPQPMKITIRVKNQQDGKEDSYKIALNAPLKKLMNAYCQKKNLEVKAVRFFYDLKPIKSRQTPAQLQMKDEDIVDMVWEHLSG